jgi:hypothetical protein
MDMRRLRVVNGDEALKETKELLSSAESLVNEGLIPRRATFLEGSSDDNLGFRVVRRLFSTELS